MQQFRTAKVILFRHDEFLQMVKDFYKGVVANDINDLLDEGMAGLPPIVIEKGFNGLTADELFDVGGAFADASFDVYGLQILTIAFLGHDGKTYFYDPELSPDDMRTLLVNSPIEEIGPDKSPTEKAV